MVLEFKRWSVAALALLAALLSACEGRIGAQARKTGGDPSLGPALISKYACGACHLIPGIKESRGTIGPSLKGIGSRTSLAGELPNTPENLRRWIEDPQSIARGTAMPDMGVSDVEARHIAAYLYTLR